LKKTEKDEEDINENIIFYMADMEREEIVPGTWMDKVSVYGVENCSPFF